MSDFFSLRLILHREFKFFYLIIFVTNPTAENLRHPALLLTKIQLFCELRETWLVLMSYSSV